MVLLSSSQVPPNLLPYNLKEVEFISPIVKKRKKTYQRVQSMFKKHHNNNEEFLCLEDILLPEGIEITLEEIFTMDNTEPITVDKDNVIQGGIVSYLLAIRNGETKVRVFRSNRLQKINIGLASAA